MAAVPKQVKLPKRIATVLEGKSLINDASSVVLYRRAVAAILAGTFSFGEGGTPPAYGGDIYPGLIRKGPICQLRVFLQDGRNDLDNDHGNSFLANQQMLEAGEWGNARVPTRGSATARATTSIMRGPMALIQMLLEA